MSLILLVQQAANALPEPLQALLSQEAGAAVLSVVGSVTLVKNFLPFITGAWALFLTTILSFVIAIYQYGLGAENVVYAVGIAIAASYTFFVTKNIGNVSPAKSPLMKLHFTFFRNARLKK